MNPNDPRLERMRRCLDGEADRADWTRFEHDLEEDEGFRLDYLRYVNLVLALEEGAGIPDAAPRDVRSPANRSPVAGAIRWLALAAGIVLLLGGASWSWLAMTGRIHPGGSRPAVGTLIFAENCEWDGVAPNEGARLLPGRLSLNGGLAVIRLDGGAELALRSKADIELVTPMEARLRLGRVTVRAEGEAAGFRLRTPSSELEDLGTEFSVAVGPDGTTDLHVIDGEVAYAESRVASRGEALRFEKGSDATVRLATTEPGFSDLVREAEPKERRDLMTVYEGFHYPDGSYLPAEINRGRGWAGPWRLRTEAEKGATGELDVTGDMRIVHGQLNVPWPVSGGRLGGLEMPSGRSYRLREMQSSIEMNRDGIVYFSMMTQEPDHEPNRRRAKPVEGMRLTFRSSADYHGECLSFGWNEGLRPQIQTGTSALYASLALVPDGQTLLWVGKIIHRGRGEDEISFRIYGESDVLEYAEPATWHVVSRGLDHGAVLDLVLLSSTGGEARIADELRIGPTWRSVVPFRSPRSTTR